jgi:ribose-phosphate pyrophosphokinase
MTIKVNNKVINCFNFSGGECHVSIADIAIDGTVNISADLYNSDDVMRLIMTVDAIRQIIADANIHLKIPYFPYARQDRVCNFGEAFAAQVMTKLINSLKCASVTVYDPHSQVIEELLDNCIVITQAQIVENSQLGATIKARNLTLLSPDAGASRKTQQLSEKLKTDAIYCTKVRDPKTGQIMTTQIPKGVSGQDFIIIDDICDGGRTFIELAKTLQSAGANKLYLYVTHGIFSKGLEVLKPYFSHVFCYHCFLQSEVIDTEFLTIIKREPQGETR